MTASEMEVVEQAEQVLAEDYQRTDWEQEGCPPRCTHCRRYVCDRNASDAHRLLCDLRTYWQDNTLPTSATLALAAAADALAEQVSEG